MRIHQTENYNVGYNYYNHNLHNKIKNIETPNNNTFTNYSSKNIKSRYLPNFLGYSDVMPSQNSRTGILTHDTSFFREPATDEIVQGHILNSNDSEVNVVSGACSAGNEARSYAMMLDSLGDKLHISGFDISEDVIDQAKSDTAQIFLFQNMTTKIPEYEYFLSDEYNDYLTPSQQRCKEKFQKYYDYGNIYVAPVYPSAEKELENLTEVMQDESTFNELRKQFYKNAKIPGKNIFIINGKQIYLNPIQDKDKISFTRTINDTINDIKLATSEFHYCQKVKAKKGSFSNCEFKQGDILNLENLYQHNSINALLYRYALYHTLCDSTLRNLRSDAKKVMDNISRQMNKVVKMGGLVVFGEDEILTGINPKIIDAAMLKNGFKKYVQNNIWIKTREIIRPF